MHDETTAPQGQRELAPCPFSHRHTPQETLEAVGGDSLIVLDNEESGGWSVFCVLCGMRGPQMSSRAGAIAAWNRRAPTQEEGEGATLYTMRCGYCGAYEGIADPNEVCPDSSEDNLHAHHFTVSEPHGNAEPTPQPSADASLVEAIADAIHAGLPLARIGRVHAVADEIAAMVGRWSEWPSAEVEALATWERDVREYADSRRHSDQLEGYVERFDRLADFLAALRTKGGHGMSEPTRQDYERVAAMMVAVADDPKYRTGIVPVTPSLLRDWADMLSAAAERMTWRPIETAPKDGTPVVLYRASVGRWVTSYVQNNDMDDDGSIVDDGWWDDPYGQECRLDSGPTHWLLLPEPPKEAL